MSDSTTDNQPKQTAQAKGAEATAIVSTSKDAPIDPKMSAEPRSIELSLEQGSEGKYIRSRVDDDK